MAILLVYEDLSDGGYSWQRSDGARGDHYTTRDAAQIAAREHQANEDTLLDVVTLDGAVTALCLAVYDSMRLLIQINYLSGVPYARITHNEPDVVLAADEIIVQADPVYQGIVRDLVCLGLLVPTGRGFRYEAPGEDHVYPVVTTWLRPPLPKEWERATR